MERKSLVNIGAVIFMFVGLSYALIRFLKLLGTSFIVKLLLGSGASSIIASLGKFFILFLAIFYVIAAAIGFFAKESPKLILVVGVLFFIFALVGVIRSAGLLNISKLVAAGLYCAYGFFNKK